MNEAYVHGYHRNENERLQDQAGTLVDLLHSDTSYPAGSLVLEAGCGVGAQTVTLARRSPDARFVSVDVSADSIAQATRAAEGAGLTNVQFRPADIFALPFAPESFDMSSSALSWSTCRVLQRRWRFPDLVDGFTRRTFTAMIEGIRAAALEAGLTHPQAFDAGIRDLHRATEADGVFCYTFFKGIGAKKRRDRRAPSPR